METNWDKAVKDYNKKTGKKLKPEEYQKKVNEILTRTGLNEEIKKVLENPKKAEEKFDTMCTSHLDDEKIQSFCKGELEEDDFYQYKWHLLFCKECEKKVMEYLDGVFTQERIREIVKSHLKKREGEDFLLELRNRLSRLAKRVGCVFRIRGPLQPELIPLGGEEVEQEEPSEQEESSVVCFKIGYDSTGATKQLSYEYKGEKVPNKVKECLNELFPQATTPLPEDDKVDEWRKLLGKIDNLPK